MNGNGKVNMQIEKCIRKIGRRILIRRLRMGQGKDIIKFNYRLKDKKSFTSYPFDKYPPAISNYSFFSKSDLKWLDFYYSIYGKPDCNFISVPVYYYIEHCLNNRLLTYAIKEKNFYNKFFTDIPTPVSFLRKINGFYYDENFKKIDRNIIIELLRKHNKLILKPSIESGAGRSIYVFENNNGIFNNGDVVLNSEFLNGFKKDFVIQKFVKQHPYFSQFNPSSNNTIKIFIYRSIKDDSVNILHCIFWVGAKGKYLDHDHLGGYGLSINEENRINEHAIDVCGEKHKTINNITLSSLDKVPAMNETRDMALKIANQIFYGRLLALDFTVDIDGKPLLLDINCWRNGINQYQMHNGGLFKEYTKEILDFCQNNQPRFVMRI